MSDLQLALPGLVHGSTHDGVEWVWWDGVDTMADAIQFVHATILRAEVTAALAPRDGGVYVDATLGGGGHTEAILEACPGARVIATDRDPAALAAAGERLARFGDRARLVRSDFSDLRRVLLAEGITQVDGLCADLGVSSPQLDDASRGMSFRRGGPLDMRMDPARGATALELIGRLSDDELADILFEYGEERRSRRIARSIKRALDDGELETTLDLRRAIVRAVGPARIGGVDPATRTFQGLRIAVNRELDELSGLLTEVRDLVRPGGVAAFLSFHSLEDRLVKRTFQERAAWQPLFKKPLMAGDEECEVNPRARSAKLRAARRLEATP